MGFMDELRKLTQPYDEEDDFFEGADGGLREQAQPSAAQIEFESNFGAETAGAPEPAPKPKAPKAAAEGGLFGGKEEKEEETEKVTEETSQAEPETPSEPEAWER